MINSGNRHDHIANELRSHGQIEDAKIHHQQAIECYSKAIDELELADDADTLGIVRLMHRDQRQQLTRLQAIGACEPSLEKSQFDAKENNQVQVDLTPLPKSADDGEYADFWDNVDRITRNMNNFTSPISATVNSIEDLGESMQQQQQQQNQHHQESHSLAKTSEEYRHENEMLKLMMQDMSVRVDELQQENQLLRRALLRLSK